MAVHVLLSCYLGMIIKTLQVGVHFQNVRWEADGRAPNVSKLEFIQWRQQKLFCCHKKTKIKMQESVQFFV